MVGILTADTELKGGGERKEGKERYYMEVEEEMKGVTADRVRKGAKGG